MEYLIGGSTGLLKEVDTTNMSLLRLSSFEDQSLDRRITSMCWSGGFGGYFEDEFTVGHLNGLIRSYNYLTMGIVREYKLDSRCIYLTMLNKHFDLLGPETYKRNSDSPLYPEGPKPSIYDENDRLLLAVSECGYIYVLDWSVSKSENVAKVKNIQQLEKGSREVNDSKIDKNKTKSNVEEFKGPIFVYKYRAPLSDASVHSLMRNRVVFGGLNNPPALFDLYSESLLWVGRFPHETLLGLQSSLEISCLCFLEELDDDMICVATRDSFVYVYDMKSQRDPIFEFNVCDYKSLGLSKRLLTLPHEDFNTRHRRALKSSLNLKYSQKDRMILRVITKPTFKLHFVRDDLSKNSGVNSGLNDSNDDNNSDENVNDFEEFKSRKNVFKLGDGLYMECLTLSKKDFCSLFLSDNIGTLYNLQFLTGVKLLQWIYRKVEGVLGSTEEGPGRNNSNSKNPKKKETPTNLKRGLSNEDVANLSDTDKNKIAEYLLEARRRLCSSSSNDKKIHFRRNHHSQVVCRILNCYNFHNGSAVDIKCLGDYLVSAGLDRFSNVVSLKTNKLVFRLYCNQKQTFILLKNEYLFKKFQDRSEFKVMKPTEGQDSSKEVKNSELKDPDDLDMDEDFVEEYSDDSEDFTEKWNEDSEEDNQSDNLQMDSDPNSELD